MPQSHGMVRDARGTKAAGTELAQTPVAKRIRTKSAENFVGDRNNMARDVQVAPNNKALLVIASVLEHHKCPITRRLLVDPVVGQDGHVYEHSAIRRWLRVKQTSPVTGKVMGAAVVPAICARQTVSEFVDKDLLDNEMLIEFLLSRGRMRATWREGNALDLEGAVQDFHRSLKAATDPEQRGLIDFQLSMVTWLQQGVALCEQARQLRSLRGTRRRPAAATARSQGQSVTTPRATCMDDELQGWMLELGDVARMVLTKPLLDGERLSEWNQHIREGTRVRVLDDVGELMRLCERPAPSATEAVAWNPAMRSWAGKACLVQRVGDSAHKNYILLLESEPSGRTFAFPYDSLFLLTVPDY